MSHIRGEELIADKEKWGGDLTVIEILTSTEKKSDGKSTSEQRLYIASIDSSAEHLSLITRRHWAIESMHRDLDRNLRQDNTSVRLKGQPGILIQSKEWCWHYLPSGKTRGKRCQTRVKVQLKLQENYRSALQSYCNY